MIKLIKTFSLLAAFCFMLTFGVVTMNSSEKGQKKDVVHNADTGSRNASTVTETHESEINVEQVAQKVKENTEKAIALGKEVARKFISDVSVDHQKHDRDIRGVELDHVSPPAHDEQHGLYEDAYVDKRDVSNSIEPRYTADSKWKSMETAQQKLLDAGKLLN